MLVCLWLFCVVCCLLFVACSSFVVRCLLFVFVVRRCLLLAGSNFMFRVCYLVVVYRLLCAGCCSLFVVFCSVFVVCCLQVVIRST